MSMYLVGDEDGGVTLYCNAEHCWAGGMGLAHYEIGTKGHVWEYRGLTIPRAESIADLLRLANEHEARMHP